MVKILLAWLTSSWLLILISVSPAKASADYCDITRTDPSTEYTWPLSAQQQSPAFMHKGDNQYLLTCELEHSAVFTFQRSGVESYAWFQDGIEQAPLPAGEIAYALPRGQVQAQIYIRSHVDYTPKFRWYPTSDYIALSQRHSLLMGIFYGLGLALVLLSIVIGWRMKGHAIKPYGFYIACLTLFFLHQEGQLYLFFGIAAVPLLNTTYLLTVGLTVFSATWFLSIFLHLKRDFARLNRTLMLLATSVLGAAVARAFADPFVFELLWQIVGIFMGYATLIIILTLFVLACIQAYRKVPEAGLVCIALSVIFVSMFFRIVLLNYSPFMQRYGFVLAFAIEAFLLAIALSRRVNRIAIARDQAEKDANIDPLCNIANRRGVSHALSRFASKANSDTCHYAAFYIDVDKFKVVNDTFGHATGDAALKRIATTVQGRMRSEDIVGRVGGDEFIAIACFQQASDVELKYRELQQALANVSISTPRGLYPLSATVGCARFAQLPGTLDQLLAASDNAMYREKTRNNSVAAV
ncbi:MAG: diguanylate cyclase [Idiomarina sp.]|nr:diguanylate cyclase [Idiomarina sp.]